VLTFNRSPADWYPLFPNAVVGESILDRLINTSRHLLMDIASPRTIDSKEALNPPSTNKDPARELHDRPPGELADR
jgi:hypothetical protein